MLGCNTILPSGRLTDCAAQFGVDMQIKSLELVKQAGFDAAEYSHIEHLDDAGLQAVADGAARHNVVPWSAHSWQAIPGDKDAVAKALAEHDRFLHKAERLGVQVVVVHCAGTARNLDDPVVRRGRLDVNLACLEPLAEKAAQANVRIAIENGGSKADWDFMIEMVRDLGHPNVGLNIDTGHANLGDMDPATAIRMAGSALITTHLQDNYGQVDDHLPPGLGRIDWPGVVGALADVGYGGCYMVEISDCPPNREPDVADIKTAHDNLARFFESGRTAS